MAHLRRARDLLDREYARPLDVPAMARAALMSPSLFSRRFREAYGDTPYGYLQARRVERAMALLRCGHMSVTDVCMAVGFTSLGSFSSTFTRLVGEPPSVYKARGCPPLPVKAHRCSPGPQSHLALIPGIRRCYSTQHVALPVEHQGGGSFGRCSVFSAACSAVASSPTAVPGARSFIASHRPGPGLLAAGPGAGHLSGR